jgi:hypothetical protein
MGFLVHWVGMTPSFSQPVITDCASEIFDCPVISPPDNNLGTIGAVSGTNISLPCFNPQNSNEFVFVRKLPDSPASTLCIHNLETGISNCLPVEHGIQFQPRWHSSGWILFRGNWSDVYRIMSTGGEIDTVSTPSETISYKRPIWRPDGQAWIANTSLNAEGDIEVYGLDGSVEEIIPGVEFNMGDWSDENRLVTKYNDGAIELKLAWTDFSESDWEIIGFDTPPFNYSILDVKWIPMSHEVLISQNQSDISRINVLTQEIQMVKNGCYDKYYGVFSISNDGSKIVAERFLTTNYYTEGLYNYKVVKKEIVIMNCDGTEEMVIDLEGSLAVVERASVKEFQVFPNPASHNVEIKSTQFVRPTDILIFNALGEQVMQAVLTGYDTQLNVSGLKSGLYLVRIGRGEKGETHKLIVE